jgi:hypothetical protein
MKLWIARDKNGELYLYNTRPKKLSRFFGYNSGYDSMLLDESLFPEVTFENSPQEVELKLVDNETRK